MGELGPHSFVGSVSNWEQIDHEIRGLPISPPFDSCLGSDLVNR